MDYLPNNATIDEACEWLQHKTGQKWTLPRLLEDGHLTPYVWNDNINGHPRIFGDKLEGYLTKMIYHGDVVRLAADRNEAVLTMYTAHDGSLLKPDPAWRVELKDIRFKKKHIERVAEIINSQKTEPDTAAPAPVVAVIEAMPDPERRLTLLRELGGTAKYTRCDWKFTGIKELVNHEKANGRKRSTDKTIRADLKEAAQNERDAKRAGFSDGLGQK